MRDTGGSPGSLRWTIAGVVGVLVAVNVLDNRVAHASLAVGPVGAAGLALAARRAGLSWAELGLGAGTWRRGLAWALAAIGAVAVVYAIGAALPLTRGAFRDTRYHLSLGNALLTAFVLIPLGTVLPWPTLGRQGRNFVAGGPDPSQISTFTGEPADEPIRVYVGLRSAPSIPAEAALAVKELDRTGAFGRKVIVVATTTGTGWLNQEMTDPLEYMYGGDTAIAAIQYSYLPSWLSFLADKGPAQEAGRDLFDAVYDRWRQLPAGHRPKLVILGESQGSFGGEAAFSGADDIRNRASGGLWVGPANSNVLWGRFVSGRDPGSPEWLPVYEGRRTVRFAARPADLDPDSQTWERPRVVYLQNANDPIIWWSPSLAFHVPGWLKGPRGPGVSPAMRWYPLVTFWQVSADMADSTPVPAGQGHVYSSLEGATAWASIIPPPGWTPDRTAALARQPDT